MGKLDEFFKLKGGEEKSKSDLEILDEIEAALREGNLEYSILQLKSIKKEHNLFLALRMIIRELTAGVENPEQSKLSPSEVMLEVKEITVVVNTLVNPAYRSILLADLAVLFYLLGDDMSGDMTLKVAVNLSLNNFSALKEIVRNLLSRELLEKAGYALKLIKNPEKLDMVFGQLAVVFYREGDVGRAMSVLEYIKNPFHKVMALCDIASFEAERDREEAGRILNVAFNLAEKIDDPNARFEINMKLYDLKHSIKGDSLSLSDVLSKGETPRE